MAAVSIKQLLEAGVHFGHQTGRWNPKMKPYIFGERNGVHIIDLQKTLALFKEAIDFVTDLAAQGKMVLFVGTKSQAQEIIEEEAIRCGMYWVNNRWLGGLLTNFSTVMNSIRRYRELESMRDNGFYEKLSKKEVARLERERKKLEKNLRGIKDIDRCPDALFVVDSNQEVIAVREAAKLGIPIVSIVDTNSDPDLIDYVIPGNDDALRAVKLFAGTVADAILAGRATYNARVEAEAKEAQERAAREEAQRQAAKEAKEAAARAAAAALTSEAEQAVEAAAETKETEVVKEPPPPVESPVPDAAANPAIEEEPQEAPLPSAQVSEETVQIPAPAAVEEKEVEGVAKEVVEGEVPEQSPPAGEPPAPEEPVEAAADAAVKAEKPKTKKSTKKKTRKKKASVAKATAEASPAPEEAKKPKSRSKAKKTKKSSKTKKSASAKKKTKSSAKSATRRGTASKKVAGSSSSTQETEEKER